jgi:hypothetical protein
MRALLVWMVFLWLGLKAAADVPTNSLKYRASFC